MPTPPIPPKFYLNTEVADTAETAEIYSNTEQTDTAGTTECYLWCSR